MQEDHRKFEARPSHIIVRGQPRLHSETCFKESERGASKMERETYIEYEYAVIINKKKPPSHPWLLTNLNS